MLTLLIFLNIFFVSFTDKPEKSAPALSPRAIEQREKWSIPTDDLDYPVCTAYLNDLRAKGVKIHHTSRWFNGATCEMDDETAEKVKELSFVAAVELTRNDTKHSPLPKKNNLPANYESNFTDNQLAVYNLHPLHEAGYEGQGILMTICDGGFYNANTLSCFRQSDLELGHFDFTDDADDFYGSSGTHGTSCLSTISGIDEQQGYYGAAPQAPYYLMRSEEANTESPKEMDNLVAALEKSDSLGVNVFSVSLGYYWFNDGHDTLPKEALNGRTTRSSVAATIAARKGMLVCAAAGNEGNKKWKTICSPADADSVLTVGAVGLDSIIGSFSSYGPSADGRVKPDVCAVGVGTAVIRPNGTIVNGNGTSYATPLLAGMAAALWSALPDESAMQIRDRIIRSADRYINPDKTRYGFGIPDAWKAYNNGKESWISGFEIEQDKPQKIIRGEQILIIRHGHIYNLAGQLVE